MTSVLCPEIEAPGFSFANCQRNASLMARGFPAPQATKTGTTIVGAIYRDGVILGADTRATEDKIISDKLSEKIHYMAPNIYCCGAGTAADTAQTTKTISSNLELHRLNTGRIVPVATACRRLCQMLFRYQGYIGAALILGGVDNQGPHLHSIYPHGSKDDLPYVCMGSGSLAAMAVLESRWKPNMEESQCKILIRDAVAAGVFNDLASGNNIDMCIIRRSGLEYIRPYEIANLKGERSLKYSYKKGTTAILKRQVVPIVIEETSIKRVPAGTEEGDAMDTN